MKKLTLTQVRKDVINLMTRTPSEQAAQIAADIAAFNAGLRPQTTEERRLKRRAIEKASRKRRAAANPEAVREKRRLKQQRQRAANPEVFRERRKRYRLAHPNLIRAQKQRQRARRAELKAEAIIARLMAESAKKGKPPVIGATLTGRVYKGYRAHWHRNKIRVFNSNFEPVFTIERWEDLEMEIDDFLELKAMGDAEVAAARVSVSDLVTVTLGPLSSSRPVNINDLSLA